MRRLALSAVVLVWAAPAAAQRLIVIDPGHGGEDPGGTGNAMEEKDVVLDVCNRFRDLLDADSADEGGGGSWRVLLTRDSDEYVSLGARSSYANDQGADRFMSIHSNAFGDPSANGTETFAYAEGGNGAALRNLVQEEMLEAWGLRDRGNKTANFAVLRETSMPAELHELAFITNAGDAALLASDADRQRAAEAHLYAIQRHFDIGAYLPGSAPSVGAVAGTVIDDAGPIAGAMVSLDGAAAVAVGEGGSFAFIDVPPGDHVVRAEAADHQPEDQPVSIVAGQTAQIEMRLVAIEPSPDVEPDPDPGADDGPNPAPDPDADPDDGIDVDPGLDAEPVPAGPTGGLAGGCSAAGARTGGPQLAVVFYLLALLAGTRTRSRNA
ncbi:MAG: N-acetylmuramoyl-L-alanine amidase [Deltaproteobacteria bacterium]|nr:N-acetylmuramoyl-L-alanine amidase [Deltaproteobacteria bacterium]